MVAYFDASSFLKLIIVESGSGEAYETWLAATRRVSSGLLYPEARAGLARAHRMRRIGDRQLEHARASIDELLGEADLLDVTETVTQLAGDLAERHALRAYDAVHLASVEVIADDQTLLVATDGDLVSAARARGIATTAL